jgi:4-alpha-glucanotransferase
MFGSRTSGILLHPTSLPSPFGIGDLGPEAYRFVDFLSESFQQIWQILPIGPTGYGNSPYLSYSALAGNPLLISPELLVKEQLLEEKDFEGLPNFSGDRVDFDTVIATKMALFKKASDRFQTDASPQQQADFAEFCDRHGDWLNDYALFMSLKEDLEGTSWNTWEEKLAKREAWALQEATERLSESIYLQKFLQFQFFQQWIALKKYANEVNISIFGDIPIYVAHDSVDVWSNPDIFCLDEETNAAALMAGVPPDYFSETGQLWGNPVYNWEKLEETNFAWWIKRVKGILDYVDIIRIDHFRGFEAFWAVPQGEETAINGEWLKALGEKFFEVLNRELGQLPIVAEDLGVITSEVEALRDKFNFPGMKVLQFAFDSDRENPFLPFNYTTRNCIVYTGTHDNNTTLGWFQERSLEERARVVDYFGCVCPEGIHWNLIRLALSSVAVCAIFPLQDILGQGTESKMNTPGKAENNWNWRYRSEDLTVDLGQKLKYLTYLYGRAPKIVPSRKKEVEEVEGIEAI